jgi:hypothetical protein
MHISHQKFYLKLVGGVHKVDSIPRKFLKKILLNSVNFLS